MKKLKDFLVKNSELFYFTGLSIAFLSFTWLKWEPAPLDFINHLEKYRYLISLLFLALRYISLFFIEKKHFFITLICFAVLTISYCFVRSTYLFQSAAVLLLSYKIEFKKIVKLVLIFSSIVLIVDLLGILTSNIDVFVAEGRYRCYLGFKHPSYFSIHFITIVFSIWYLFLRKFALISTLLFAISGLFLWLIPNTMATSIIMFLMPIVLFISKLILKSSNKFLSNLICVLPIVFMIISVLLTYFSNDINLSVLPQTLGLRLSIPKQYWINFGIHLFKGSNMWVDNSYMFLLELFGIIPTILYMIFFIKTVTKIINDKNYYVLAIFIVLLIYTLIDNYCLNPRYNLSLFYLFAIERKNI